jgi:hypothetical protein
MDERRKKKIYEIALLRDWLIEGTKSINIEFPEEIKILKSTYMKGKSTKFWCRVKRGREK